MNANPNMIDATSAEERSFSADEYLLNIIKRALANQQDIQISIPGRGSITLLSSIGEYFNHTDSLESFCKMHASKFKISIINPREASNDQVGRNIEDLMWMAGFYASNGLLMEGLYRDDVVELMHWPNFTRLPMTRNSLRIASLLSSRPTSITFAQRFLKIDSSEIFQFYTAAHCAGLARAINKTAVEPPMKPHRNQPLLGLLLSKISGI